MLNKELKEKVENHISKFKEKDLDLRGEYKLSCLKTFYLWLQMWEDNKNVERLIEIEDRFDYEFTKLYWYFRDLK